MKIGAVNMLWLMVIGVSKDVLRNVIYVFVARVKCNATRDNDKIMAISDCFERYLSRIPQSSIRATLACVFPKSALV